jgi:hypothetical protein
MKIRELHLSLTDFVLVLEAGCWRPRKPGHPLETALQEIERALDAKLFYAAIMMTLALPGLCAALERENFYSGRDEYKQWYRDNLAHKFTYMSDEVAYSLRCGVVHLGNLHVKTKDATADRVMFTLPGSMLMHNSFMQGRPEGNVLQFDAIQFCADIIEVVRIWYKRKSDDPIIAANLPFLLQLRPNGFGGILGYPVIA